MASCKKLGGSVRDLTDIEFRRLTRGTEKNKKKFKKVDVQAEVQIRSLRNTS